MRFSQRKGLSPVKSAIQRDGMDKDLENGLWSCLQLALLDDVDRTKFISHNEPFNIFFRKMWLNFFKRPLDSLPDYWPETRKSLRTWYFEASWYRKLDFVEFVANNLTRHRKDKFVVLANQVLENEMSAYRLVDGILTDISDEQELESIRLAMTDTSVMVPVREHFRTALKLLSDRKSPDFRNSIKESISAVEAIAQLISDDKNASLGKALRALNSRGVEIHPALLKSWSSLYGYTSNADGIRHALMDKSELSFTEAKYMLVCCSAFVNLLVDQARKSGVSLEASAP